MKNTTIIGLMSGTSLDGLDICAINFEFVNSKWTFKILNSETIYYSDKLKTKFKNATKLSSIDLLRFDVELGQLFGGLTKQFIISNKLKVDGVASHGHTIFHQPNEGVTLQIGDGQEIANVVQLPVVYNFRSKDVSLGGQGAPLVPIGDELLFSEYDACINFGGIANISFQKDKERVAFDICPFNMGLNFLANQLGLDYDESGKIAENGQMIHELLVELSQLEYYNLSFPKSLGVEWFNEFCLPLISNGNYSIEDRLHTFSHHISDQLLKVVLVIEGESILITGGGVYNSFIINLLKSQTDKNIITPTNDVVDFKEALIFAFLGVLRMDNKINVLKSVTGAVKSSVSGVIAYP
jgi:anhydro-N-acetylmuramic acid kinase